MVGPEWRSSRNLQTSQVLRSTHVPKYKAVNLVSIPNYAKSPSLHDVIFYSRIKPLLQPLFYPQFTAGETHYETSKSRARSPGGMDTFSLTPGESVVVSYLPPTPHTAPSQRGPLWCGCC